MDVKDLQDTLLNEKKEEGHETWDEGVYTYSYRQRSLEGHGI